jgi:hypothetical protein
MQAMATADLLTQQEALPLILESPGSEAPRRTRVAAPPSATVTISGTALPVSQVFDTYWRFAAERQRVYFGRLSGRPGPWTDDRILMEHRFTNAYRAADRVSQYLIRSVIYEGDQNFTEVFFRTLLFKIFNKIETWELLVGSLGFPAWSTFDLKRYDRVLSQSFSRGQRLYSAAYVMAPPRLGATRKHTNHLRLLEHMMRVGVPDKLQAAACMADAFDVLRAQPAIGDFLAFQYLIDLNYSEGLNFNEMDFVVAGPGAKDGIRKCFGSAARGLEADVIRYMADSQDEHFSRLGLPFDRLGDRPLQLIDCQNLFCEVDKYARVAHPTIAGISGRTRIKQKFRRNEAPLRAWFPPKWEVELYLSEVGARKDRPTRVSLAVSQDPG